MVEYFVHVCVCVCVWFQGAGWRLLRRGRNGQVLPPRPTGHRLRPQRRHGDVQRRQDEHGAGVQTEDRMGVSFFLFSFVMREWIRIRILRADK